MEREESEVEVEVVVEYWQGTSTAWKTGTARVRLNCRRRTRLRDDLETRLVESIVFLDTLAPEVGDGGVDGTESVVSGTRS